MTFFMILPMEGAIAPANTPYQMIMTNIFGHQQLQLIIREVQFLIKKHMWNVLIPCRMEITVYQYKIISNPVQRLLTSSRKNRFFHNFIICVTQYIIVVRNNIVFWLLFYRQFLLFLTKRSRHGQIPLLLTSSKIMTS